ncbi:transcriptional regulator [Spirochaetia bacterium]|nr:transcriptional regulator [Spirochaetia bacterium]
MESLGDKLKAARELKGYTYDQVSRETNIAGRYLEALEQEDFSIFPGEPYLLGFLRNYGEYLALDVGELLSLYRSLKIQEQPIPVEQLLRSPPNYAKIILSILIPLLVLGAAGGGYYLFKNRPRKEASAAPVRSATEYVMSTDSLERRFYRGDSILIPLGTDQYKLALSNLGEALTITTPGGAVMLDLSQEVNVDLNNDGIAELRITAADFVKNDSAAGALLRFEMNNGIPVLDTPPSAEGAAPPAVSGPGVTVIFPASPRDPPIISPYPFTLQFAFQGYCMFRWEILRERDRRDRNEQYFQRGDELNIQAQNGIRIWVSNAQVAKLQVIGGSRTVTQELGGAGEVVVAEILWVQDEEKHYRLVLARLESAVPQ